MAARQVQYVHSWRERQRVLDEIRLAFYGYVLEMQRRPQPFVSEVSFMPGGIDFH